MLPKDRELLPYWCDAYLGGSKGQHLEAIDCKRAGERREPDSHWLPLKKGV
jgi:hypothetical protein